ncbi:ribosome hibernation promotion factor, partial [Mycolicibacterium sp.]
THGEFPGAADYVRDKFDDLGRYAHRPIRRVHVKLLRRHDPAVAHPVIAQANLDIDGRPVRGQVEADTAREAIDRLQDRLQRRLEHLAEIHARRRGPDAAPPWRRIRPGSADQPLGRPRIIRRKSYTMAPCTVDEAVTELELLDYDFHLFTEIGSGAAAVLYRGGPTGYRLSLVAPAVAGEVAPYQSLVTISPHPVPCLREDDACERLALLGVPFLFFVEAAQGRAGVLYRRFDGHYGLITPAG